MNKEELFEVIEDIDERFVKEAKELRTKRKAPGWVKWGALAACLGLVLLGTLVLRSNDPATNTPVGDACGGPPAVTVDGVSYMESSYFTSYSSCPEGFSFAGEIQDGEFDGAEYYTNPNVWEYIYLRLEDRYGAKVFIRFVVEHIRGKDYVSYNGQLYISMWSAAYWGEHPDITKDQHDMIRRTYDIRFEGEPPEGFVSAGVAEFSGHDTVPTGDLACNTEAAEVFVNPQDDTVILLPTSWHTHTAQEEHDTLHTGFNVYVKLEE